VLAWGLLNANKRTLLIAIFAFLDAPAFYFLLEVTLFNLAMLLLMLAELRLERQLVARARAGAGAA
ncbi:MAG TPA: hypothetical protein VIK87_08460, partial [Sphingomonadales bacterium]